MAHVDSIQIILVCTKGAKSSKLAIPFDIKWNEFLSQLKTEYPGAVGVRYSKDARGIDVLNKIELAKFCDWADELFCSGSGWGNESEGNIELTVDVLEEQVVVPPTAAVQRPQSATRRGVHVSQW